MELPNSMVTVATLNLLDYQARPEERLALIVAGIADEWPDLIALQEVSTARRMGVRLQDALNAEAMKRGAAVAYQCVEQPNLRNHELTVGILSRCPILDQTWTDLKGQGRVALGVTVAVGGVRRGARHCGPAGDVGARRGLPTGAYTEVD
jgi:hypothetical protein